MLKSALMAIYDNEFGTEAWDDPNKFNLDVDKMRDARDVELKFFRDRGDYFKEPRWMAEQSGAKIIKFPLGRREQRRRG